MGDDYYHIDDFGLFLIWATLRNDLERIYDQIDQEKDKVELRRNYVRTLFSLVEAISYKTRQILIAKHNKKEIELSDNEIYLLKEKSIDISPSGKIKIRDRYLNFETIFKFTYKLYSKYLKKELLYKELISDSKYKYFIEAFKIRNRITHPRGPESILITKEEFLHIENAYGWYNNFIINMLEGDVLVKKTELE